MGVREEDLTFRRGVAGFFARGHHRPPPGAEILARLVDPEDGEPIVYVDRVSTAGVILVHAGNDLIASVDRDSTAGRIAAQLVGWMLAETAQLARRGAGVSLAERPPDARRSPRSTAAPPSSIAPSTSRSTASTSTRSSIYWTCRTSI